MIALPPQLFYGTQIPACLWFLTKNKKNSKFSNREGKTLFIDARKLGVLIDRVHRDLTSEEIGRIAGTYHAWRGGRDAGKYADVPGFCKSATLEEFRQHGYVLTPGRYVDAEEVEDDGEPFEEKLNRRMNETLEAMARAIFKSWFIDFDPVCSNADQRTTQFADMFPGAFAESPLGPIPQGWTIKAIGDVSERVGMGPFGASIKVETFVPEGMPIISGQHLDRFVLKDNDFNFITPEHADRLANAIVKRGDVIFTHAGNIGQVALIPPNSRYEQYIISQRQFFMRCAPSQITPLFITLYFTSDQGRHRLLANSSSSGVPSIARPVTYLRSIPILVPPRDILQLFERVTEPLILKLRHNDDEIEALVELRDFILPKLVSGKLRIKAAEAICEAHA